jgi:UDPglucose 6-dehydrogenase
MIGCGKLGLMVALTIESKGHEVKGFDISQQAAWYLDRRSIPFKEENSEKLLAATKMQMVPLKELCDWADILFLAPQTPHGPEFEGTAPLPAERADFDYSFLVDCVQAVDRNLRAPKVCAIISTVLPGTIEREVLPIVSGFFDLVYTPQFIAMGTVYRDFCNPEFWLIGADKKGAAKVIGRFFESISDAPHVVTDIKTAEGIKVFYNTFITTKTVLANLYGEAAHRLGMNVDDIFKAVSLSTRRLLSTRYLEAGMGDGGGCHPRDNIALSWLARENDFSFDFFDALMTARQNHCEFLAGLIEEEWERASYALPVVILGRAFKPETNIETGSPAILLSNLLERRGIRHQSLDDHVFLEPAIVFIGCKHERYKSLHFADGSVVIDPFRYLAPQDGVKLISIGAGHSTLRDHRACAAAD